jgi:hypothetical protein
VVCLMFAYSYRSGFILVSMFSKPVLPRCLNLDHVEAALEIWEHFMYMGRCIVCIPGATRLRSTGYGTGSTQPREYN